MQIDSLTVDEGQLGKMAMLVAMSCDTEEARLREQLAVGPIKIGVTYVAGHLGSVRTNFIRALVASAQENGVINSDVGQVHAVVHAGLEAFHGVTPLITAWECSVKFKAAIVQNGVWVAVAVYGRSAAHQATNHERCGFGLMHL